MRLLSQLTLLLLALTFTFCNEPAQNSETQQAVATGDRIEVIDFHSTHRCATCLAIEANTKFTVETYFGEQLKQGTVTLAVFDVEQEENAAIAEKFEAVGTSLFLNVVKDGKEKQIDLTDFAFMWGNEKDEFTSELKQKIEAELKML